MGITSFILGIISLILSFLPFMHFVGIVPAIIGLILGITDLIYTRKNGDYKRGFSISGIVLCFIAILLSIFWTILIVVAII
ncbi:MAG: hypothetical protein JXQ23_04565 [Clostridia bacterium]|nr:hypothetical protein [Clostridia bacterium]